MNPSSERAIVSMVFANRHINPVLVFWLHPDEQEAQQHLLGPGESYTQQSYQGDTWIFRDAVNREEVLRISAKADATVSIKAEQLKRKVRNNGLPGIDASYRPENDDTQFALAFDGNNDSILVPERIVGTDLGDTWTLEAWIYRRQSGALHPILDKTDGKSGGYFMRIGANDRLQGGIQQDGKLIFGESASPVPAGRWVHVAVVFHATRYTVQCYVDGELKPTSLNIAAPQTEQRPVAKFSGQQWFEAERSDLGKHDALTIEAWVKPDATPAVKPLAVNRPRFERTSLICTEETNINIKLLPQHQQISSAITVEYWYKGTQLEYPFLYNVSDTLLATRRGEHWVRSTKLKDRIPVGDGANDGEWHHIAFTWQQGVSGGFVSYIDGEVQARSDTTNEPIKLQYNPSHQFHIQLGARSLRGQLAEFRIWSVARSQAQIRDTMHKQLRGREPGLACYLPLQEAIDFVADLVSGQFCPVEMGGWQVQTETNRPALMLRGQDYVKIPAGVFTTVRTGMTIECWFRGSNFQSAVAITDHTKLPYRYLISLGVQTTLDVPGMQNHLQLPATVNDGNWHHVALTFRPSGRDESSGATKPAVRMLYLDGKKVVGDEMVGDWPTTIYDQFELFLGSYRGETNFLQGELAEVRIWNVTRTREQIASFRNQSLDGNETGLVGYWRLDDGSGEIAKDYTANARHGRLYGSASWARAGSITAVDGAAIWSNQDEDHDHALLLRPEGNSYRPVWRIAGTEVIAAHTIPINRWTHLAAVWEAKRTFRLYVNGDLSNAADTKAPGAKIAIGGKLYLGFNPASQRGYLGELAHVRLWRKAFAAEDVARYRRRSVPATAPDLLADWHLDDVAPDATQAIYQIAHDYSSNGQHISMPQRAVMSLNVGGKGLLYVVHHQTLNLPNSMTLELWLKLDRLNGSRMSLITKGTAFCIAVVKTGTNQDSPVILEATLVFANRRELKTISLQSPVGVKLEGQSWLHVTLLSDHQQRQTHLIVHHAGQSKDNRSSQAWPDGYDPTTNQEPIWLGSEGDLAATQICEVRLWNTARSLTEITQSRYRTSASLRGTDGLAAAWLSGDQWWQDHGPHGVPAVPAAVGSAPINEQKVERYDFTVSFWFRVLTWNFRRCNLFFADGTYEDRGVNGLTLLSFTGDNDNRRKHLHLLNDADRYYNGVSIPIDVSLNSPHHLVVAISQPFVTIYLDGREIQKRDLYRTNLKFIYMNRRHLQENTSIQLDDIRMLPKACSPLEVVNTPETMRGQADPRALLSSCSAETHNISKSLLQQDYALVLRNNATPSATTTTDLALLPDRLACHASPSPLRIGVGGGAAPAFLAGMIDSLRIWDVARTSTQVTNSWNRLVGEQNQGLRAYYRFDEGKNTLVQDSTAARNHGRFQGEPTWELIDAADLPGDEDNQFVLSFDGQDDAVVVANPGDTGLALSGTWTVEAWVYRQERGKVHPIIDKTDGEQGGYFVRLSAADTLQGGIRKGKTLIFVESDAVIEPMRWVHVAVSFDPEHYSGACYINGNPTPARLRQELDSAYFSTVADLKGQRYFSARQSILRDVRSFTAELWFKPHAFSSNDVALLAEVSKQRDVGILLRGKDQQGQLAFRIHGREIATPPGSVALDAWQHVAAVWQSGKQFRLYHNGELLVQDDANAPTTPLSLGEALFLGFNPATTSGFHGEMAAVRLWEEALSADTLQEHRMRIFPPGTTGLAAAWQLDEPWLNSRFLPDPQISDSSGRNQHLSANLSQARSLDVSGRRGSLTTPLKQALGEQFTLEAWLNAEQITGREHVLVRTPGWQLAIQKDPLYTGNQPAITFAVSPSSESNGVLFNGTSDHVVVANTANLNLSQGTVEVWVYVDRFKAESWQGPIVSQHTEGKGWELRAGKGQVAFILYTNSREYSVTANLSPGVWYHLAASWSSRNGIALYINGVSTATHPALEISLTTPVDLQIGRNPGWTDRAFAGRIREVRLWQTELSAAQISANMQRKITGRETSLLGCWLLNGTQAHDVTGQYSVTPYITATTAAVPTVDPRRRMLVVDAINPIGAGWLHVAVVHSLVSADLYTANLKSVQQAATPVEITFTNEYRNPVQVFWVDHLGIETLQAQLEPKATYKLGTYAGHAWRFRDESGQTIAEYVAPSSKASFAIKEQQRSKVWIYVTPQGAANTRVFVREFDADVRIIAADTIQIGDLRPSDADLRLSEIRLWREARHPTLLDRFRYHQYSAVHRANPNLVGLWLSGTADGTDASSAANHLSGPPELLKTIITESALLLYGPNAPWRNSRSDFALLPATLNTPVNHMPLKIGAALPNNTNRYMGNAENTSFQGLLDAVRIWSLVRSPAEIGRFWNQSLSGTEPGLRAYYRFDEGKGETVYDRSPFGNHGRFGGANDVNDVRVWQIARSAADLRATLAQSLTKQEGLVINWPLAEINQAPSESEIAESEAIDLNGDFTLELRLNVRTLNMGGSYHAVLYRTDAWALNVIAEQSELYAGFYFTYVGREPDQPWQSLIAYETPITRAEWVHLAVVGDRKQGKLSLYVDGVEHAMPFRDLRGQVYAIPSKGLPIQVGGEGKPAWWKSNLLIIDGLEFDGRNDFLRLPPIDEDWSKGITVEAWVYYDGFKPWSRILDLADASGASGLVLANEAETNTLLLQVRNAGTEAQLRVEHCLEVQRWQHLAALISPTRDEHDQITAITAQIYKNGELIAEQAGFQLPSGAWEHNFAGRSNRAGDGFFHGRLDEIRLWRAPRSADALQTYLRREVPRSHRDLAGLWSFEEGSGNAAYDGSVNGYHGLLGDGKASAAPRWLNLSERRNAGLLFDGIDDLVLFPHEAEFDFPGHFTVECWVKIAAWMQPWQTIVSKGDSWQIRRYDETGRITFSTAGLSNSELQSSSEIGDDRWHHIAVVYNRRHKYLYIDGKQDALEVSTGKLSLNDAPLVLGAHPDFPARAFAGHIDELRIWGVARKAAEIAANLHARIDNDTDGLVGYWPMNENFGAIIADKSGHDLHGRLGDGQEERMPSWSEASPLQFGGFHFNGRGDYLEVENSASLNLCSDFTVSAWVRPALFGGMQTILSKTSDLFNVQYALSLEGVQLRFDYARDGNNFAVVAGELKDGWNHVAVVVRSNAVQVEQVEILPTDPAIAAALRVMAYSGPNYTGQSRELALGEHDAAGLNFGSDGIRSLRVPAGLNVLAFEQDIPGEGRWMRVSADEPELIHPLAASTADAVKRYGSLRVTAEQVVREQRINQPKINLFVNGLLVHATQAPLATTPSDAALWIGGWGGDVGSSAALRHFFHGRLDVVCLWNIALSQDQVQATMHSELEPIPEAVAALWYLDEDENLDATGLVDQSRNANHGRYRFFTPSVDDPTTLQRPALSFDGFKTTAALESLAVPHANQPYTIEILCKPAGDADMALLSWGEAEPNKLTELRLLSGRRIAHCWGGPDLIADLPADFGEGWHQIAATWDGTRRTIYLDGSLLASDTPEPHAAAATVARLGSGAAGAYFNGLLADLRIWQRARSRFEIKADLNRLLLGNEPGLSGYWRLNEGHDSLITNLAVLTAQPDRIRDLLVWSHNSNLPPYTILEDDPQMDALLFNPDAYAEVPGHVDFKLGAALTFECRLQVERGATDWHSIIAHGDNGWYVEQDQQSGRIAFGMRGEPPLLGQKAINDGRFHHLAIVCRRVEDTADSYVQQIFVNGILDVERTGKLAPPTPPKPQQPKPNRPQQRPNFGRDFDDFRPAPAPEPNRPPAPQPLRLGRQFGGLLGEVRLWRIALEPQQIRYNLQHAILASDPDLLAYWHFGEQSGREILDYSGREHHGTLAGTVTWIENSGVPLTAPATCLEFDGHDDHLISDDLVALPPCNITLEAWLRPRSARAQTLFSIACADGRTLSVGFSATTTLSFAFGTEHGFSAEVGELGDQWLHLACVYNHAEQRRCIHVSRINEQGMIETQTFLDTNTLEMPALKGKLMIAAGHGEQAAFHGSLSEVRLWQIARNREEIRAGLSRRMRGSAEGLLAYWPLNETQLPYVRDHGFDGYHLLRCGPTIRMLDGLTLKTGAGIKLPPDMQAVATSYEQSLKRSLGLLPDPLDGAGLEPVALPVIAFEQPEIAAFEQAGDLEIFDIQQRGEVIERTATLERAGTIRRSDGLERALVLARRSLARREVAGGIAGNGFFRNLPRPQEPFRSVLGAILHALAAQGDSPAKQEALQSCRAYVLNGDTPPPAEIAAIAAAAAQEAVLTLNSDLLGALDIFAEQLLLNLPEISVRTPQLIALGLDGSFAVQGGVTVEGVEAEVEVHILGPDHHSVVLRFLGDLPLSRVIETVAFGSFNLPALVLVQPEIAVTRGPAAGDGGLALHAQAIILDNVQAEVSLSAEQSGTELLYQLTFAINEGKLSDIFDEIPEVGDLDLANAVIQPAQLDVRYGPLQRRSSGAEGGEAVQAADGANYHQISLDGTLLLGTRQCVLDTQFIRIPAVQPGGGGGTDYTISLHLESAEPGSGFVLSAFIDDLPQFGQLDLSKAIIDKAHLDIAKDSLNPELAGATFSFSLDGDVSNVFSGKTISLDSDFRRYSEPGAAPSGWRRQSAGESEFRLRLTGKEPAPEPVAFGDVFDDFPAIGSIEMSSVHVEEFEIVIWKKAIVGEGGRRAPRSSDIRCSFDGKVLFNEQYRLTLDSDFIRYHDLSNGSGIEQFDFSLILRLDERGGGPRSMPFKNIVDEMPAVGNFDLTSANQGQSVSVSDLEIAITRTTLKQRRSGGGVGGPAQNFLALSFDGTIEDLFAGHRFSLNADFMKYSETLGKAGATGRGKGIDALDFTVRLALEKHAAGSAGENGISLGAIFEDFPQFGELGGDAISLDEIEFVLKRSSSTQAAKAGAKIAPKDSEVQLSIDGKASLKLGDRRYQIALDTDFSKHLYAGAKSKSMQDLDIKVQIQLSEGSFAFGDIFPDFPAFEQIDLAAATISRPTLLIHTNTGKRVATAGTAGAPASAKAGGPSTAYECFSVNGDITLFGLELQLDADLIGYHQSKGKKSTSELDYTITIAPAGMELPDTRRGPQDFVAPVAANGPAVPFSKVIEDFPAMGNLDLGILEINGFYLRINKNTLSKNKPAAGAKPAATSPLVQAAGEPAITPPTLASATPPSDPAPPPSAPPTNADAANATLGAAPAASSGLGSGGATAAAGAAAPPAAPTPGGIVATPVSSAIQVEFGGQVDIAGKDFRLDARFEKASARKGEVVKQAASGYMVKLTMNDEIGFNALVDDVDSFANFDLSSFGIKKPSIMISKSSDQTKSNLSNQIILSISSELVTAAGVAGKLEMQYSKAAQSRAGSAASAATLQGSQAEYRIEFELLEEVNFSRLIEALPAIEDLDFETLSLKAATKLTLVRGQQQGRTAVTRSGESTLTIAGPVGTTLGDMTITAQYRKVAGQSGTTGTSEYLIEIKAEDEIELAEIFGDLGLDDNPFGESLAALPLLKPYFRITNQPGSLSAAPTQQ